MPGTIVSLTLGWGTHLIFVRPVLRPVVQGEQLEGSPPRHTVPPHFIQELVIHEPLQVSGYGCGRLVGFYGPIPQVYPDQHIRHDLLFMGQEKDMVS